MASVRDHAKEENLEVIAVYDPYRLAKEDAAAKAKEWFGTTATQCRSVDVAGNGKHLVGRASR